MTSTCFFERPLRRNETVPSMRAKRVVFSSADVSSSVEAIADLANQDIAGYDCFTTELLNAAVLRVRITSVSRTALSLL